MRFSPAQRSSGRAAFTLVEVILAIGIATGILVVALSFYQQAANLRGQILEASNRISTIRLLMDRLTIELRSARGHDWEGFTGDAASLRFVRTDALSPNAWTRTQPYTDLKLVTYGVAAGIEGTNTIVTGITRTEHAVIEPRQVRAASVMEPSSSTNTFVEPLTDAIRFLHFRFWDGTIWVESWDDIVPPLAVEVSFGIEPQPEDALPDEYPFEVFRRVVLLPGGREGDPWDLFAGAVGDGELAGSKP